MKNLTVGALATLALVACGGTVTPPSTECQATVSGAQTYAGKCILSVISSTSSGQVVLSLTISNPGGFHGSCILTNTSSTSFSSTSFSAANISAAACTYGDSTGKLYTVALSKTSPADNVGTVAVTVTDAGSPLGSSGTISYYNERGSLDATLPADKNGSATGTVTIHATF